MLLSPDLVFCLAPSVTQSAPLFCDGRRPLLPQQSQSRTSGGPARSRPALPHADRARRPVDQQTTPVLLDHRLLVLPAPVGFLPVLPIVVVLALLLLPVGHHLGLVGANARPPGRSRSRGERSAIFAHPAFCAAASIQPSEPAGSGEAGQPCSPHPRCGAVVAPHVHHCSTITLQPQQRHHATSAG